MRYRPFGRTGLRLSAIALGTANFGTGWGHGADADTSRSILDAYSDAGGNFIDGDRLVELFLVAVGQRDDGHGAVGLK